MFPFPFPGSGEFGDVFLVQAKAVKNSDPQASSVLMAKSLVHSKDEEALTEFKREIDLFSKLDHAHVVKMIGLSRDGDPHYLLLEYTDWVSYDNWGIDTRVKCLGSCHCVSEGGKYIITSCPIPSCFHNGTSSTIRWQSEVLNKVGIVLNLLPSFFPVVKEGRATRICLRAYLIFSKLSSQKLSIYKFIIYSNHLYPLCLQGDLKQFLLATRKDSKETKPPGGPVKPKVRSLSSSQAIRMAYQAALGLEHLSERRLVHKDVAARNCLISSDLSVKISLSGLSKDTYQKEYYKYRWVVKTADVCKSGHGTPKIWIF